MEDVTLNLFYTPHTITALVLGGVFLVYSAFQERAADSTFENINRGLQVRFWDASPHVVVFWGT